MMFDYLNANLEMNQINRKESFAFKLKTKRKCYLKKESCNHLPPCVSVIYETALNRFPFDFEEEVTLWNTFSLIKLIVKVYFYNFVTQSKEINKTERQALTENSTDHHSLILQNKNLNFNCSDHSFVFQ